MFILFKYLFERYELIAVLLLKRSSLLVYSIFVKDIDSSESTHLYTLECQPGHYGNDCSNQCSLNCNVTRSCDKSTGQCEGGCMPGWTGDTCDQSECLTFL